jgi:hypothetical protein
MALVEEEEEEEAEKGEGGGKYDWLIAIIEEEVDVEERRQMALELDEDEFKEQLKEKVLDRVTYGHAGISKALESDEIDAYLHEQYVEARKSIAPPTPPPAPAPAPSLWERVKRGIRRIFGR